MADEKNRSDFEDPKVDADPLNDLVRLLNEEDPFSNFSANRSRDFYNDGGEATRRQEPQQVEMAAPALHSSDATEYDNEYTADSAYSDEQELLISEENEWEEQSPYNEPDYQEPAFQNTQHKPATEDMSDLERLEADLADSLRSSLEAYAPQKPASEYETGYDEPSFEGEEDDEWFEANEPMLSSATESEKQPLYADNVISDEETYTSADDDLVSSRLGYASTDYVDPLYEMSTSDPRVDGPESLHIEEENSYGPSDQAFDAGENYTEEDAFEEDIYSSSPNYTTAAQTDEQYPHTFEDDELTSYREDAENFDAYAPSHAEDYSPEGSALPEEEPSYAVADSNDPLALDDIFSKSLSDEIQSNLRGSIDGGSYAQEQALEETLEEENFEAGFDENENSAASSGSFADENQNEPIIEGGIFAPDTVVGSMATAVKTGLALNEDFSSTEYANSEASSLETDFDEAPTASNAPAYSENEQDEYSYQEEDYAPTQKQGSKLKFAALAAAVIAAAGAGYFMLTGNSNPGNDQAPVIIKADEGQIKTNVAENATPAATPSTDQNLIYDRVSGAQTKPQERIQPRQEEVLPVETAPASPPATIDSTSNAVGTPRRVQSVTIKPDGTITRTPAPQPEVPNLTVAQPETPSSSNGVRVITANPSLPTTAPVEVPGRETVAAPAATPVQSAETPSQPVQNTEVSEVAPIELRPTPLEPSQGEQPQSTTEGTETPAEPAIPAIAIGSAPVPQKRPGLGSVVAQRPAVNLQTPVSIGGAPQVDGRAALEQAQAAQAQTQAELRPTTQVASNSNSGGFVVQLSAQRSQEEALRSFQALQNRFPQLLTGQEANIQRADLGARGVYYRLGVGPIASRDQASQLCNQLKTSGLPDCFVRAN